MTSLADSLDESWHEDRAAVRDLVEQVMALDSASAPCRDDAGLDPPADPAPLVGRLLPEPLGDSAAQSIAIAESLLADQERVLGNDHPDTLTTRNNLASAYRDAGRTAEAIALHQQNLTDRSGCWATTTPTP